VDNVTRFTEFTLRVVLEAPQGVDEPKAMKLLEKSERSCLITNSLIAKAHLIAEVQVAK
jgi:uncharacterized OsmC-like protein